MNGDKGYAICPKCGEIVTFMKFCEQCGASLAGAEKAASKPVTGGRPGAGGNGSVPSGASWVTVLSGQGEAADEPHPVDDSGLTFLGEFCKKTVATVGGDGYSETVLYEDETDGSFQIHTYSKYDYMPKELHHSYRAKDGAYDALLALVEELRLEEYEGKRGFGLCGGMYICKFRKDGTVHAVTTDNCGSEGPSLIMKVGNLLGSYVGEELTAQG